MFRNLDHRFVHYLLLLAAGATLFFVNLGGPSLWDWDEGRNATAALEMLEAGDWVKPTFNGELRSHKPVLQYWLQMIAYLHFGVNEFSARLPSALAAVFALLVTYELGHRMFGSTTGVLAGLVLASTVSFCAAARFANPDALLNLFTAMSLWFFWQGLTSGRRTWFLLVGASVGFAVLAKGPVGIVMPGMVMGIFLVWSRQLSWTMVRRLALGTVPFLLVALPWYVWVAVETKGQYVREFLLTHNLDRGLNAMENHRGPIYYYPLVLAAGFAPWSAFFGLTIWSLWWGRRSCLPMGMADKSVCPSDSQVRPADAKRLLISWIVAYLVVFTIAATKLPNYILPLYPALALLMAHDLDRWRRGDLTVPNWLMHVCLAALVVTGASVTIGILVVAGTIEVPVLRGRILNGVEAWAFLGTLPVLGALVTWWCWRRQRRVAALASLCVSAVVFLGPLAAWGSAAFDRFKAPKPLVEQAGALQRDQEIRIGGYQLEHLPSLHFYVQRSVKHQASEDEAARFLRSKLPVFLFVSAPHWLHLQNKVAVPLRVAARHHDLYRNCEVVVVTNR